MNYDDSGEFQNYKIVSIKIVSSSSLSLSRPQYLNSRSLLFPIEINLTKKKKFSLK